SKKRKTQLYQNGAGQRHVQGPLQFDHAEGNVIDVRHGTRAFGMFTHNREFLSESKAVLLRFFSVNQPDRLFARQSPRSRPKRLGKSLS
ncbi:MAG: hypothetical protein ACI87E_004147, partial [Mariniblastus sp.]